MHLQEVTDAHQQLHTFITFLYEGLEGYVYLATKDPQDGTDWEQHFFRYPEDASRLESTVIQTTKTREVYLAPAVFNEPAATKEHVAASNVVWCEFDGNAPSESDYSNPPSYRIKSSNDGHEHCYWRLSEPLYNTARLEEINRNLTYSLSADASGWDATQVLRPPGTVNHKRQAATDTIVAYDTSYDTANFNSLPAAPTLVDAENWSPSVIPDITAVVLKYPFPDQAAQLYKANEEWVNRKFPQEKRSGGLMQLAYFCCEMGMTDPEIYAVLYNADERWKKFKGRRDRTKRLAEIISRARVKHPYAEESDGFVTQIFDYVSFLNTEIEIDWVVENMLMEQGSLLLTGPGGLGKTQLSLQWAQHLALGKDFLGYSVGRPRRILFLSLEMGHKALKVFASQMAAYYSEQELTALQKQLFIIPHGEPWALDTPVGQERLLRVIRDLEPEGLFVDSVGSSISGDISAEGPVKKLVGFNDAIIKHFDLFTWYVHHMRKANNDNRTPETQDDVYGNQYLLNRASSVYGLFRGSKNSNKLRIKNLKMRLSEMEKEYQIERIQGLNFQRVNDVPFNPTTQHLVYKKPEEEKGPVSDPDDTAGPGGKFKL